VAGVSLEKTSQTIDHKIPSPPKYLLDIQTIVLSVFTKKIKEISPTISKYEWYSII